MSHTNSELFNYTRLYFRPLTPTQFNNEGIRPIDKRSIESHCPIPVYFLFDAVSILSTDETEYSNGNMASLKAIKSDRKEFYLELPFGYIFSSGPMPKTETDIYTFHRNAEILIPTKLMLDNRLKAIVCRSSAERQTLLELLPTKTRTQWDPVIRISKQGLLYRKWTFVVEVVVIDDQIHFRFNPSTETPGPFHVKLTFQPFRTNNLQTLEEEVDNLRGSWQIRVSNPRNGLITLYLDDSLAFRGSITFKQIK